MEQQPRQAPLLSLPPRGQSRSFTTLQTRYTRVDFPKFNEEDPLSWTYQAQLYFSYNQTPAGENVALASFHLEGKAVQWFHWMEGTISTWSWKEFRTALCAHFGANEYTWPGEMLARLQQKGMVQDYLDEFERLANLTVKGPKPFMIYCFVGGLKDDIRGDVKILNQKSLTQAIRLA